MFLIKAHLAKVSKPRSRDVLPIQRPDRIETLGDYEWTVPVNEMALAYGFEEFLVA